MWQGFGVAQEHVARGAGEWGKPEVHIGYKGQCCIGYKYQGNYARGDDY